MLLSRIKKLAILSVFVSFNLLGAFHKFCLGFSCPQVTQCLTEHIGSALDRSDNPDDIEAEDERAKEVQMIRDAQAAGAVYVIGRSEFRVNSNASCINRLFAGALYPFLNSICRSRVATLHIPPASCLEVGMHYDLAWMLIFLILSMHTQWNFSGRT